MEHVPVEDGERREGGMGGLLDEDMARVEHRRHNHLGGHRFGERELKRRKMLLINNHIDTVNS